MNGAEFFYPLSSKELGYFKLYAVTLNISIYFFPSKILYQRSIVRSKRPWVSFSGKTEHVLKEMMT